MAEKGYMLSKSLLDKVRMTNERAARNPLYNQTTENYVGQVNHQRYFIKITGKYTGSSFYDYLPETAYSGVQVYTDSAGDFEEVVDGLIWGDDTDSSSVGPVIDVNSVNISNLEDKDLADFEIEVGTVLECFYLGAKDGEIRWYVDASFDDYIAESTVIYNDSAVWDSVGDPRYTESAFTDSGWPTGTNNGYFIVTVQTRTFYGSDSTQDRILYGYARDFTYSPDGRLISMSIERRYVIDDPNLCA